jgi:hypothetical protein
VLNPRLGELDGKPTFNASLKWTNVKSSGKASKNVDINVKKGGVGCCAFSFTVAVAGSR